MSDSKEAFYLVENMSGVMNFVGAKANHNLYEKMKLLAFLAKSKEERVLEIIASPLKLVMQLKLPMALLQNLQVLLMRLMKKNKK